MIFTIVFTLSMVAIGGAGSVVHWLLYAGPPTPSPAVRAMERKIARWKIAQFSIAPIDPILSKIGGGHANFGRNGLERHMSCIKQL